MDGTGDGDDEGDDGDDDGGAAVVQMAVGSFRGIIFATISFHIKPSSPSIRVLQCLHTWLHRPRRWHISVAQRTDYGSQSAMCPGTLTFQSCGARRRRRVCKEQEYMNQKFICERRRHNRGGHHIISNFIHSQASQVQLIYTGGEMK